MLKPVALLALVGVLATARAQGETVAEEELAFGASVIELNETNFEHLTQAATGATSGDWLVLFCKESVSRCAKVTSNWERVATTLAASREAKGLQRINVASVDVTDSEWLRKRFAIQSVPVVYLFKSGMMYSFQGGGYSTERLVAFAERDYKRSNRQPVPPEPHIATPHDQTFLLTIGAHGRHCFGRHVLLQCPQLLEHTHARTRAHPPTHIYTQARRTQARRTQARCTHTNLAARAVLAGTVGAGAAVLFVVDLLLARYYSYQKRKAKKEKAAKAAAASASS
jgi:hypothetical protein